MGLIYHLSHFCFFPAEPNDLPVDSVAGLALELGVPVHVEQKEMVGADQVQTNATFIQYVTNKRG